MAAVPASAPKKPSGQGGKAPAFVQPVNHQERPASNTFGFPPGASLRGGEWSDHAQRSSPRGVSGTGKGAR